MSYKRLEKKKEMQDGKLRKKGFFMNDSNRHVRSYNYCHSCETDYKK